MTTRSALFVGDISVDLTMTIDHVPVPDEKVHVASAAEAAGGVVANAAVAAAHAGAAVTLLVQVGHDTAGRLAVEGVAAAGVSVRAGHADGGTCRVVILIEPHGEKRLLLYPGSSMYPSAGQVRSESLAGVGWVHTAAYDSQAAIALAERCRAGAIPWSIDLEPATIPDAVEGISAFVAGAETVFVNSRAAARLGSDAAGRLFAMGARAVVLTHGPDGAELVGADGRRYAAPAPPAQVVDTTGAGDCLAGWFVAGRLAGLAEDVALGRAVIAATLSCRRVGAQSSFPTPDEVARACGPRDAARTEKLA
jgi:ribokinase